MTVEYKMLVDCSLPPEHPDHARLVPLDKDELAQRKVDAAAAVTARKQKAGEDLRAERDRLLAASDWTQVPDAPIIDRQAWVVYRQQLRDLPANTPNPADTTWPAPPEGG